MTGLCDSGHVVYWRNTRGSQKPKTCDHDDCNAPVRLAKHEGGQVVLATVRGGKMMSCSLCPHKVRVSDEDRARWIVNEDSVFEVTHREPYRHTKERVIAGSVVCWRHTKIDANTGAYIFAR